MDKNRNALGIFRQSRNENFDSIKVLCCWQCKFHVFTFLSEDQICYTNFCHTEILAKFAKNILWQCLHCQMHRNKTPQRRARKLAVITACIGQCWLSGLPVSPLQKGEWLSFWEWGSSSCSDGDIPETNLNPQSWQTPTCVMLPWLLGCVVLCLLGAGPNQRKCKRQLFRQKLLINDPKENVAKEGRNEEQWIGQIWANKYYPLNNKNNAYVILNTYMLK